MRAVLTRVDSASVEIGGNIKGSINKGFLVLLAVKTGDTELEAKKLASKICSLRIFEDKDEKMNLSLADVGGEILIISQFTLFADCKKGRRPYFSLAARPETAIPLYELFISECRSAGFTVQTGEFGADMKVSSVNNGPVTIILDTDEWREQ